jgi:light-regulated signal transduction histidine kinase (bacteriophytochrome)
LRSIEGFAKILLRDYADQHLDETANDYLQRMRAAAGRMGQLIEDLLELSQVSRAELSLDCVDISRVATETLHELKIRDPQRDVEVIIEPDMTATGDPRLLSVVLGNLLGNAWKFTSKTRHARIEFRREHNGAGLESGTSPDAFYIRDNGAGFDPAFADKLFAPFQRLHRVSEFEGTGVGLAIVQRVIQRHNGQIWAQSAVGEGATFHFTLDRESRTV